MKNMNRRTFLQASAATVALAALNPLKLIAEGQNSMTLPDYEKWQHSNAEWQKMLSAEQYRVLRKHGTERAGTSPLNAEKRKGTFHCAGCDLPVFASEHKYESGTGWPSFYDLKWPNHVGTQNDYTLIWPRTEVHCARCKGHLGHVFKDGPQPTGLRYCLNGVALTFKAA